MSKEEFIKSLDVTNNLKYKYNELLNKYKINTKKVLEENNIKDIEENSLIQNLSKIIAIIPNKSQPIQEAIDMIYSDEYLTEYNYKKLSDLFNDIFNK